ncbi:DUF2301 domain-containing membrane protein [Rodentibacter myodis]|uniref:Integral membrane protein n=1 Tax=Rodentibacter myodis TaxID=1907939 RepID=A0A1V3JR15_9PAST|nr:DUF2301 domain-containing membrane protein [Rodentibacter myodis]OOF59091.1 hypothetical protein BKL49_06025 [Rodentibacter myodis]
MADPHIQSPMDSWDKITVVIYRTGFLIAGFSLLLLTWFPAKAEIATLLAATCCASSLHIYLKHFRLIFQFATWMGLVCAILGWNELALGGALLTLGGLCFKEYFCFRVPLLNFQPFFVAALWFAWVFEGGVLTRIFSIIVGALLLILAIQKWRMPLYFDIGDKTKYQI